MAPKSTVPQDHLKNITGCLAVAADTLEILSDNLNVPFLGAICNTTQSLLKNIQSVKQNKDDCTKLMEQTVDLLNAIIAVHITSDACAELPPSVLHDIGKFTSTLHKIHTFVEAQQTGSTLRRIFRQAEMSNLLKDCKAGLQQGFESFQIHTAKFAAEVTERQQEIQKKHQEVLKMIEALSDTTSSEKASTISKIYSGSHNSSNSISMLPSEPKIFHGRATEISEILKIFSQETPRIAILGAGGMGKTTLARAIIHHTEITSRYDQHRFFVACDSTTIKVELAATIGAHLGLKPGKDASQLVIKHFSGGPPSLLILDNLETLWEPTESCSQVEEFLSLLTNVDHLALIVTMRGAERPGKVRWSRPFLRPLQPLEQDAARQTFIDITDSSHNLDEVDKVLSLANNMPLAVILLAHLVDLEGCSHVLSQWEEQRTSLISEGYDRRSNLDLSISLSLSSPRLKAFPHSQNLLSLLSILPDGLSHVELLQSKLPLVDPLACKAALIRTALAYYDEHNRLKVLVPIREYMQKCQPAGDHLVRPILNYFQGLLEFHMEYSGTQSTSGAVARISANYSNIQNVLLHGLKQGHPDLVDTIYCTCYLNNFSLIVSQGAISLMGNIQNILPQPRDYRLEVYVATELFNARGDIQISDPETLVSQVLDHFKQFEDPDLECRFYVIVAHYTFLYKHDPPAAIIFCQTAISLSISTGNTKRQSQAVDELALIEYHLGQYSEALTHALEAERLARISAGLFREASALRVAAMCSYALGNYRKSVSLCSRGRYLLRLCGISNSTLDCAIMNTLAEVHMLKSEYVEARNIHIHIMQFTSPDKDPYNYTGALMNIAELDVSMGAPKDDVQVNIETTRKIFGTMGFVLGEQFCEAILADLYLREGNTLAAKPLFKKCINLSIGHSTQTISYCLERLGNIRRWNRSQTPSTATFLFLVHSLKFKEKLGLLKALQFLGDVFLGQDDEDTATSLYTVALNGFTQMDVHRSRAECMLCLGDISMEHGDLFKAVKLWATARPLFKRSSQVKQVECIDERLSRISTDVMKQYNINSASLTELKSGTAEVEGDLSGVEDL